MATCLGFSGCAWECASVLFWRSSGQNVRELSFREARLPAIKLITIDLDDTVWPCAPVIRAAEHALYEWLGGVAERLIQVHDLASLREHRRAVMAAYPEIAHDLTEVRRVSLRELLTELGYLPGLADEGIRLFLDHRNRVEPYLDVHQALVALSRRYLLVSITNGNAEVARTPLHGLFKLSLSAAEVGAARPDTRIFVAALRETRTDPRQALHVGDDPYLDVAAANGLGMSTAWVNRDGREWPAALMRPDVEVSDFSQLQDWLEQRDG